MAANNGKAAESAIKNPYPWWAARAWHGMPWRVWGPLLWEHAGRIALKNYPMVATVSMAAVFNSTMSAVQRMLLGRRVAETELVEAPIFIIGHWRSGTTMLHELLVLDDRFTSPTTYQCMAPDHFLVTTWMLPVLPILMPSRRPMDNMAMGFTRPQEDEFALCNLGAPSPYLHCAFPSGRARYGADLDFADASPEKIEGWKRSLDSFLRRLTYRTPKRIVLKSPPHLARVALILDLFPKARFVHIVRDPRDVFSSTIKLWRTLYESHSFERPSDETMDEDVFAWFERLYRRFEADRGGLAPSQLCEVRYEDLLRDPQGQMAQIYSQLELDGYEQARPKIAAYFENARDYRASQHRLAPSVRERIDQRWGPYMRRFGYCSESVATGGELAAG